MASSTPTITGKRKLDSYDSFDSDPTDIYESRPGKRRRVSTQRAVRRPPKTKIPCIMPFSLLSTSSAPSSAKWPRECGLDGCRQPLNSKGDQNRHLLSLRHQQHSPFCPACGTSVTRRDSFKRHLGNPIRGQACQDALGEDIMKELGWAGGVTIRVQYYPPLFSLILIKQRLWQIGTRKKIIRGFRPFLPSCFVSCFVFCLLCSLLALFV